MRKDYLKMMLNRKLIHVPKMGMLAVEHSAQFDPLEWN